MSTNIAAVTVLFNPHQEFLINIYSYSELVSLLVIVDNSEKPDTSFYKSIQNDPKVRLIINHENKGIAAALNDAVKLASAEGFEWILTMDQDSFFEYGMFKNYINAFDQLPGKDSIAVIGPLYEKDIKPYSNEEFRKVNSVITSGSILNIQIYHKIDGFNENLFIDEVDHEYCYRARINGFSIIQMQHIFLQHSLGRSKFVTTISGEKNKLKALHSPIRLYYIVRNSCYVISAYKKWFPGEMRLKRKDVFIRVKNNFLYGKNRMAILKYVFLGLIDCKRNRLGKY